MSHSFFPRGYVCLFVLLAALVLVPAPASATNLSVNCPTDNLQGAINSLDPLGPHTITVTGTCTEHITIDGKARLTIEAPVGLTATIQSGAPGDGIVVQVINSRVIALRRLVIRNGSIGVRLTVGSESRFEACTIENNTLQGVRVLDHSIGRFGGWEGAPFTSRNNGQQGVDAENSYVYLNGYVTIENNGYPDGGSGLRLVASTAYTYGYPGENIIRGNNALGANVMRNSTLTTWATLRLENNSLGGIQMWEAATALFIGFEDSGAFYGVIIENNPRVGLWVSGSHASLIGPHRIRNNGSGAENIGGVLLTGSATLSVQGADVSNNIGPGILVEANANLELSDSRITNNSQEGLLVRRLATAGLYTDPAYPLVLSGNGNANLFCDTTSLVYGDPSGITNIRCNRIEQEKGPPRGGRVHEEFDHGKPPKP